MTPDIAALVARVRQGDPDAVSALADLAEMELVRPSATVNASQLPEPARRRGGDPYPDKRAERNDAAIELAWLIGGDLALEEKGRATAIAVVMDTKISRYRPAPDDQSAPGERGLLYRIYKTGLHHQFSCRSIRRVIKNALAKQ